MDIKTAIAATPMLRKGWRMVPGPLKLPVLLAGGAYAIYYVVSGKGEQKEAEAVGHDLDQDPQRGS
ncbi:MAG: hypothetical protein KY461_04725 [Actinobacteria bacterium]|nr:hypothetical protein [Actinomycetota bacterium]